jgi:hypothetical protein
MIEQVHMTPNRPASGNPATTLSLHVACLGRGVPEQVRSAAARL